MGKLRRFVTLAVVLIATIALTIGCKPENWPGGLSSTSPLATPTKSLAFVSPQRTPRPAPLLSSAIQVGNLAELTSSDARLKNWQLNHVWLEGNVLLGFVGAEDQSKLVVVNVDSGETLGFDAPFLAGARLPVLERYVMWEKPYDHWKKSSLVIHDTLTGKEWEYGGDDGHWLSNPDVSGHMLVWQDKKATNTRDIDIHAYDIDSKQELIVAQRPGYQVQPKIDGDWVVYLEAKSTDPHDTRADVYLHNLLTGEDFLVGTVPYVAPEGLTYGIAHGRVVWVGWTPDETKQQGWPPPFHIYDLQSRTDRILDNWSTCPPTGFQLAGDLIQFSCEGDFYGYDLAKNALFSIPRLRGVGDIYLSETRVVFQMQVEEPKIYLTPGAPTATPGSVVPQPAQFQLFVAPINRR
jgi:hypothetical protein